MKTAFIFIFLISGLFDVSEKTTINIISVDPDIITYAKVNCSEFPNAFENTEIKRLKISNGWRVNEILNLLKGLQPPNNPRSIDARSRIIITYPLSTDTICADRFLLIYKGSLYSMPDELRKIVWDKKIKNR